jgi:hypothetical protein
LFLSELWGQESDGCVATLGLLEPLREAFTSTLIAVPGDLEALERASELISAAGFDRVRMRALTDPIVAAGELMNHLYLEMWLSLDEDTEALYAYTAELCSDGDRLEETLQRAYMLRIAHLPTSAPFDSLLLNNSQLAPFLLALPGADSHAIDPPSEVAITQASWELFRQLLRPYLEPLTPESVDVIAECRRDRRDEVEALKRQTKRLAEQIAMPDTPERLIEQVEEFIRLHVADDVAEVLRLNNEAKQRFLDSILSDRGTWAAAIATAHGSASGSVEWTLGGVIGAIATLGSKGYATLAERRRELAASDYRLIYNISR